MINNPSDIGFVQDITQLDTLRQQAINGDEASEKSALEAAAKQFESIFTTMLFDSMRDANKEFKSDLFDSQTEDFYGKMLDEQRSSEMSASGSLGLADMIVKQLSAGQSNETGKAGSDRFEEAMARVNRANAERGLDKADKVQVAPPIQYVQQPKRFDSPEHFVNRLKPYAEKAAKSLGVSPSLLLAQAALETGWGKKVVKNASQSSNNLFNIKADRSWKGEKVATQTLEYHEKTPVMEQAAFRAYPTYQESFNDYVRFLNQNPRYQSALQNNNKNDAFIHGIHKAGYATDPEYANKVLRVQKQIEQMNSI
ncbi:flagellar assembly peptidoglycan hydrolase FlgJ [Vibrio sp. RC27]